MNKITKKQTKLTGLTPEEKANRLKNQKKASQEKAKTSPRNDFESAMSALLNPSPSLPPSTLGSLRNSLNVGTIASIAKKQWEYYPFITPDNFTRSYTDTDRDHWMYASEFYKIFYSRPRWTEDNFAHEVFLSLNIKLSPIMIRSLFCFFDLDWNPALCYVYNGFKTDWQGRNTA